MYCQIHSREDAREFVKTRRRSRSVLTNSIASQRLCFWQNMKKHNWIQLWHFNVKFKEKNHTLSPVHYACLAVLFYLTPTHWHPIKAIIRGYTFKCHIYTYYTGIVVYSFRNYILGIANFVNLWQFSGQKTSPFYNISMVDPTSHFVFPNHSHDVMCDVTLWCHK